MPKANNKDCYYFSHDCNARNDEKIMMLRAVHGLEGYAVYFMLIEILREQPNYKLAITKYTWNTLAMQMQCGADKIKEIVENCCNEFIVGENSLLKIEDDFLFSESLLRRMSVVDEISENRSKSANKRWEKRQNANAIQVQCNSNLNKTKLNKRNIPPIVPQGDDCSPADEVQKPTPKPRSDITQERFDEFWDAYPRKVGKDDAFRAFQKKVTSRETLEAILKALEWQRDSDSWLKEDGQYTPYPSTYLNQGRWKDEQPDEPPSHAGYVPSPEMLALRRGEFERVLK